MNAIEKEMKRKALKEMIETLENGYDGYFSDLIEMLPKTKFTDDIDEADEIIKFLGLERVLEIIDKDREQSIVYVDFENPVPIVNFMYKALAKELYRNFRDLIGGGEILDATTSKGRYLIGDIKCNEEINSKLLVLLNLILKITKQSKEE